MEPPWRVESLTIDDLHGGLPTLRDLFGEFAPLELPGVENAPVTPVETPWTSTLDLLDARWRPLAEGLRTHGVREPDEVEFDLMTRGRVIDTRAVLAWRLPGEAIVALIDTPTTCDARCVVATPDTPAETVASALAEQGVTG